MTTAPTPRRLRDRLLTEAFNAILRAMGTAAKLRRWAIRRVAGAAQAS